MLNTSVAADVHVTDSLVWPNSSSHSILLHFWEKFVISGGKHPTMCCMCGFLLMVFFRLFKIRWN